MYVGNFPRTLLIAIYKENVELVHVPYTICYAISYLVLDHLVVALVRGNGAEVLMRPCMARNLVPFFFHTPDYGWPCCPLVIDRTLAEIDTSDKERGFCTVCSKLFQHLGGVNERAVIIGDSDLVCLSARIDPLSTVYMVAKPWARDGDSTGSGGNLIGITSWSKLELTVWCHAKVLCSESYEVSACTARFCVTNTYFLSHTTR